MKEETHLFQPSLQPNVSYETKSFNLNRYLLVGFIGGVIPALVLGIASSVWLRTTRVITVLITALGLILVAGVVFMDSIVSNSTSFQNTLEVTRICGFVLALVVRGLLHRRYRYNTVYGSTVSLVGPGIFLIIAGYVGDIGISQLGQVIHNNFVH